MQEIINYNCDGMCIQEICDKRYTKMIIREINGLNVVLGFCDEHAEVFEDYIFNKKEVQNEKQEGSRATKTNLQV